MRQDQFERLQSLHEELTDLFLDEADPKRWPGAGIDLATMDKQTRGDRYWSKKNAVGTIALMQRIESLVEVVRAKTANDDPENPAAVSDTPDDLDAEVDAAEKEAKRLLSGIQSGSKAAFDKHVHGKT